MQQRVGNRYWSNAGNIMLAEGADPVGSPYAPAQDAGSLIEGMEYGGALKVLIQIPTRVSQLPERTTASTHSNCKPDLTACWPKQKAAS